MPRLTVVCWSLPLELESSRLVFPRTARPGSTPFSPTPSTWQQLIVNKMDSSKLPYSETRFKEIKKEQSPYSDPKRWVLQIGILAESKWHLGSKRTGSLKEVIPEKWVGWFLSLILKEVLSERWCKRLTTEHQNTLTKQESNSWRHSVKRIFA